MQIDVLATLRKVDRGAEILGLTPQQVKDNSRLMQLCIEAANNEGSWSPLVTG